MAWGWESFLGAASALVAAAPILRSIPTPPPPLPRGGGCSWVGCGCHTFQTKFQFCRVQCMGGIKLQLLCGVRIELAVGSLPYSGNYLDFQFVSPGWDRPSSGLSICKPCLDMRQNLSRDIHFPSYGRFPLPKPKLKKPTWSSSKLQNLKHNLLNLFRLDCYIRLVSYKSPLVH